jgi:hypothetical protein
MSHTHFHHWGARTQDQIQRLQQTTDYGNGSDYRDTEPRLLQDGQIVIDRGIEGVLQWLKNPAAITGSYYNGCFSSAEFSQWYASSSGFENKWYSVHDTSLNEEAFLGSSTSDAEMMVGVSYNTLYGAGVSTGGGTVGDYLSLKTSGLTDVDYSGTVNPGIGEILEEGTAAGKVDISGSRSNAFGWITNIANQAGTSGSVLMKINATEIS